MIFNVCVEHASHGLVMTSINTALTRKIQKIVKNQQGSLLWFQSASELVIYLCSHNPY